MYDKILSDGGLTVHEHKSIVDQPRIVSHGHFEEQKGVFAKIMLDKMRKGWYMFSHLNAAMKATNPVVWSALKLLQEPEIPLDEDEKYIMPSDPDKKNATKRLVRKLLVLIYSDHLLSCKVTHLHAHKTHWFCLWPGLTPKQKSEILDR